MATQAPPQTSALVATGQSQALTADAGVEFNLDAFPTDRFNRLVPTQTIRMPSDLVIPVVQVVQLDPDTKGPDVYSNRDIGEGKAALTRVGLRKVATAAAVSISDSRRTHDGSKPGECEMTVTAEMVLPTGQRIRAIGTKRIVMDDQSWASAAQRGKFQSALQEHTAARAENRAIRSLLSLRGSYPVNDLRKPFAVVTYAPNMNHPEVRAQVIAAMTGTVAGAYGPEPQKPLGGGEPVQMIAAASDDDDATEGQFVEVKTNGHATVDKATGDIVASSDEPDWFGDATEKKPDLADILRAIAKANAAETGPATQNQKAGLKGVLQGVNSGQVLAVLKATWGLGALTEIEERHAVAILETSKTLGADQLRTQWVALAADQDRLAELAQSAS